MHMTNVPTLLNRWILKTDYLTSCNEVGKLLDEEPFEWSGTGLNDGETISFEAPKKWRVLRQQMGHGAFYGMQIIVYGQLVSPSLVRLLVQADHLRAQLHLFLKEKTIIH